MGQYVKWGDCNVLLDHVETSWKQSRLLSVDNAILLAALEDFFRMICFRSDVYWRRRMKVNAAFFSVLYLHDWNILQSTISSL